MPTAPAVTVVGIGDDGWAGLTGAAQAALAACDVVIGGDRQLALVRDHVGTVETWPHDLIGAVDRLPQTHAGRRVAVLASGDPLFYGIGTAILRALGREQVTVLPHPSSASLACARLGWSLERVGVLSAVGRPVAALRPLLHPGARVLILTADEDGAERVARCVRDSGWTAALTVLERLDGPAERVRTLTTDDADGFRHDRLSVVAVECSTPPSRPLSRTPGLPDEVFASDGVLTKQEVRAVTLAALVPLPGQLLWDVGAGSGSVAVEWLRTDPTCLAVAIEPRADRCAFIRRNAECLGVPALQVVEAAAPAALAGLPAPDAVFVGGGATVPGVLEACVEALAPGARLVVNAVTVETEAVLVGWQAKVGGLLRRIDIAHAAPVGGFTAFRPALPVTQWVHTA